MRVLAARMAPGCVWFPGILGGAESGAPTAGSGGRRQGPHNTQGALPCEAVITSAHPPPKTGLLFCLWLVCMWEHLPSLNLGFFSSQLHSEFQNKSSQQSREGLGALDTTNPFSGA